MQDSVIGNLYVLGGGFIFFIFTPIWGRFPFWLMLFRWVETTKQYIYIYAYNRILTFLHALYAVGIYVQNLFDPSKGVVLVVFFPSKRRVMGLRVFCGCISFPVTVTTVTVTTTMIPILVQDPQWNFPFGRRLAFERLLWRMIPLLVAKEKNIFFGGSNHTNLVGGFKCF